MRALQVEKERNERREAIQYLSLNVEIVLITAEKLLELFSRESRHTGVGKLADTGCSQSLLPVASRRLGKDYKSQD